MKFFIRKGLNGDHAKEGYKISHKIKDDQLHISAHSKAGKKVGSAHIQIKGEDLHPIKTAVAKPHQRKGIATAMYDHAEKVTGGGMVRGVDQTAPAKHLWKKRMQS